MKNFSFVILIMLLVTCSPVLAQEKYVAEPSQSSIQIHGTSTLHDWTSDVEEYGCTAWISTKDGELLDIKDLSLKIKTKSIESGKSKMNELTYEALRASDQPYITFEHDNECTIKQTKAAVKGNLSLAGETRKIAVAGAYDVKSNGDIFIKGKKTLNMTDFDIDPPKAMLGTVVVGEEVTIEFKLLLKKN